MTPVTSHSCCVGRWHKFSLHSCRWVSRGVIHPAVDLFFIPHCPTWSIKYCRKFCRKMAPYKRRCNWFVYSNIQHVWWCFGHCGLRKLDKSKDAINWLYLGVFLTCGKHRIQVECFGKKCAVRQILSGVSVIASIFPYLWSALMFITQVLRKNSLRRIASQQGQFELTAWFDPKITCKGTQNKHDSSSIILPSVCEEILERF